MYDLILADPAWVQGKGGKKSVRPNSSGDDLEYTTISLDEIESILRQSRDKANENHVLFLWTIDKYLFEAEQIAHNLGYKRHARMIWNKIVGIPAAFTVRFGHEYLLFMHHGKLLPVAKEQRGKFHTVFHEQPKAHSLKPKFSYDMINKLYPSAKKLELFCRVKRNGWDTWGNEVECDIEIDGFVSKPKSQEFSLFS